MQTDNTTAHIPFSFEPSHHQRALPTRAWEGEVRETEIRQCVCCVGHCCCGGRETVHDQQGIIRQQTFPALVSTVSSRAPFYYTPLPLPYTHMPCFAMVASTHTNTQLIYHSLFLTTTKVGTTLQEPALDHRHV